MINGQPYSYYGFEIVKVNGVLDMPSRIGDVVYDWGDYIEPLVHEKDIAWKHKEIKIEVLFDGSRHGITYSESLSRLTSLPKEFTLTTKYGDYTVNLKEAVIIKKHTDQYITLNLIFHENNPEFINSVLDDPIGGNGASIDGYELENDFGILISEVKLLDNIPSLKQSNVTTFQKSKPLTKFRGLKTIQLSCFKLFTDYNELKETTEKFKKILSQKDFRILILNNKHYNCFLTEGFVILINKDHIKFDLKMNITANFVEDGFVEYGFVN